MTLNEGEGVGAAPKAAETPNAANAADKMKRRKTRRRGNMRPHSTSSRRLPATWMVGTRTRLRPIEPDDVSLLRRWRNSVRGLTGLRETLPKSDSALVAWAAKVSSGNDRRAFIVQTLGGKDVGLTSLDVEEARATLDLALVKDDLWQDGHAQDAVAVFVNAAFCVLPLQRIQVLVLPDDLLAVASYESAGFSREGILRRYVFARGQSRDVLLMSVLREEWQRKQSAQE